MSVRIIIRSVATILCFAAAACGLGSSDEPKRWKFGEGAEQRPCGAFAAAYCDRMETCGVFGVASNSNDGRRYRDLQTCLEREEIGCEVRYPWASAHQISGCVDELDEQSCDSLSEQIFFGGGPRCLRKENGASCGSSEECLSYKCGDAAVCVDAWAAPVGDACDVELACFYRAQCVEGRCARSEEATCDADCEEMIVAATDRCDSAISEEDAWFRCEPGLECFGRNDMGSGNCTAYAEVGERCGDTWDTQVGPCLWPAICDFEQDEPRCTIPSSK